MLFIGLVYFFAMSFLNMKIVSDPSQCVYTVVYGYLIFAIPSDWQPLGPDYAGREGSCFARLY